MAENYKLLYEQTKRMLTMYQDEVVPGYRKKIEELETASKWIPVSERLPEQHSSVIVYRKTKRFSMLHYSNALGFHFYDSEWGDVTVDDVTHWMPLPEPPKEKDHEV